MNSNKKDYLRIFICFAYLFTLIFFIYGEVKGLKYVSINPYKRDVLWSSALIWGIIPIAGISILFIKSEKKWLKAVKYILAVVLLMYLVLVNFLAILGRGIVVEKNFC